MTPGFTCTFPVSWQSISFCPNRLSIRSFLPNLLNCQPHYILTPPESWAALNVAADATGFLSTAFTTLCACCFLLHAVHFDAAHVAIPQPRLTHTRKPQHVDRHGAKHYAWWTMGCSGWDASLYGVIKNKLQSDGPYVGEEFSSPRPVCAV